MLGLIQIMRQIRVVVDEIDTKYVVPLCLDC